jgi:hypothetical protein
MSLPLLFTACKNPFSSGRETSVYTAKFMRSLLLSLLFLEMMPGMAVSAIAGGNVMVWRIDFSEATDTSGGHVERIVELEFMKQITVTMQERGLKTNKQQTYV